MRVAHRDRDEEVVKKVPKLRQLHLVAVKIKELCQVDTIKEVKENLKQTFWHWSWFIGHSPPSGPSTPSISWTFLYSKFTLPGQPFILWSPIQILKKKPHKFKIYIPSGLNFYSKFQTLKRGLYTTKYQIKNITKVWKKPKKRKKHLKINLNLCPLFYILTGLYFL